MLATDGMCQCGCGRRAPIVQKTNRAKNVRRGEPAHFVVGHGMRGKRGARGAESGNWKGGRHLGSKGYVMVVVPDHPHADKNGSVREHTLVAERVLGRPLPGRAVVHHVDEDRTNNAPTNLVICEDRAYHALIHRRMRALAACGNPNWRKCPFCKQYDDPATLRRHGDAWSHPQCHRDDSNSRRAHTNPPSRRFRLLIEDE